MAAQELRSRAAKTYAAAGMTEQAVNELLAVVRWRVRHASELVDADIERLRKWLPDDRCLEADAWSACRVWPERRDEARRILKLALDQRVLDGAPAEDLQYWRLVLTELSLLAGEPSEAIAYGESAAGAVDPDASFEVILSALTLTEAKEHLDAESATDEWESLRAWAGSHEETDPSSAAVIHARWAVSRVLNSEADAARAAFATAAQLWGRVPGADDQVAEMYFAAQTSDQLAGRWLPEGAEWRSIAASLRGTADTPAARADRLEARATTERLVGSAIEARRSLWFALIEHLRAGNLRGQFFIWHLLGELHQHANHHGEAVAAFVRCGREDDARKAAGDATVDEVLGAIATTGPRWQQSASLAAVSVVARRVTRPAAASLIHWALKHASTSASGPDVFMAVRAVEALAGLIFVVDGEDFEMSLERLREFADVPDLRFTRPATEALMLATNCRISDETETVISTFASEHSQLAAISSLWIGDRLQQVPNLAEPVRRAALAGRLDALEALAIADLVEADAALQQRVDEVVHDRVNQELGRDTEGNVIGLASFEGLGILGRVATSPAARAALAEHLLAFVENENEPQVNRASAANGLFNLRRGLSADEAAPIASRLLPTAAGKSAASRWDATPQEVADPFNRIRLGFMSAADELQAAALTAAAALYDHAGKAHEALEDTIHLASIASNPVLASSAWDAVSLMRGMPVPGGLESALTHTEWLVRLAAIRCWTQRCASSPPWAIVERLIADRMINVRIELVALAQAKRDQQALQALASDVDAYVRALVRTPAAHD